jgi:ubiquinone/menaquinone biosynthesis C-methylase UbiE
MNLQNKNEHDQKVGTYFDKAATTFDTFYDHKRSAFMQWVDREYRSDIFTRYRLAFEVLEPMSGKTVIDIGCGSGPYVVEACRRGCEKVIGFDMADGMLELAKKRAESVGCLEKCQFIQGAFPETVPEEKCDYAIVMGVMDYIADPSAFFDTLARQVTDRAVLSMPCIHWFRTPLRKIRYWLKRCPVYFYETEQIKEYSKVAGFSNIKIEKMPGAGMDYFVTVFK